MKPEPMKMHPIIVLEQIPGSNTAENPNTCGYETILIWKFNFDGDGSALVSYDDSPELDFCSGIDLQYMLLGNPGNGHRWYQPVNLSLAAPR